MQEWLAFASIGGRVERARFSGEKTLPYQPKRPFATSGKKRGAPHASGATHSPPEGIDPAHRYFYRLRDGRDGCLGIVREPVIRMSTRRRALGSQPGRAVVWKTPTSARTKSMGSVSERRSPLAMAFLTAATKAV